MDARETMCEVFWERVLEFWFRRGSPTFVVRTPRATTALCGSTREVSQEGFCEGEGEMAGKTNKGDARIAFSKQKEKLIKITNKQKRV